MADPISPLTKRDRSLKVAYVRSFFSFSIPVNNKMTRRDKSQKERKKEETNKKQQTNKQNEWATHY